MWHERVARKVRRVDPRWRKIREASVGETEMRPERRSRERKDGDMEKAERDQKRSGEGCTHRGVER